MTRWSGGPAVGTPAGVAFTTPGFEGLVGLDIGALGCSGAERRRVPDGEVGFPPGAATRRGAAWSAGPATRTPAPAPGPGPARLLKPLKPVSTFAFAGADGVELALLPADCCRTTGCERTAAGAVRLSGSDTCRVTTFGEPAFGSETWRATRAFGSEACRRTSLALVGDELADETDFGSETRRSTWD